MIDTAPLIAEITAAFDGVSREDGVSLREGRALDDYWRRTDEQCIAARALDTDTRWQDVSDEDIKRYQIAMSFVDAKGFRYYIPAWMIYDLRHNIHPVYGLRSIILYNLRLPDETKPEIRELYLERFNLITPEQGKAVCSFLKFLVVNGQTFERPCAAEALADYWNRYADSEG